MLQFLKTRKPRPPKTLSPSNGGGGNHPADPDRNTLYSLGTVINVKPSDRFALTPRQEGYYVMAKGTASILLDDRFEIKPLKEGEGICTTMLPDSGVYALSLRGDEGFRLVHLSSTAMKTLNTPLQAEIEKNTSHIVRLAKRSIPSVDGPKESPGDYVRSRLRAERRSLLERYESSAFIQKALEDLRSLPTVSRRFIGLSMSDPLNSAEIVAFIKNDPSLTTEVLRVVNSSFHGLRNKVSDINHAVLYLGLGQIFQIVVSAGLQKLGGQSNTLTGIFNHSVIISNLVGLLSAAGGRKPSPMGATIGILHDVGEIFKTTMKEKNKGLDVLLDHLSGPKLGSMLLARWGIPEPVCKAIELQEQCPYSLPEELDEPHRAHAACLHLAHRVCECVNHEGLPTDPLTEAYLSFLGFGGMSLEQLVRLYVIPELRANTNKLPIEVQVFFSI